MDRQGLAWAAGLFEGEGTVSASGQKHARSPVLHASVQMTDEDVVRRLHGLIGFGSIYGPYPSHGPPPSGLRKDGRPYEPLWVYRANSYEKVQALCAFLWPWLGLRRRGQFRRVLRMGQEGILRLPYETLAFRLFGKRLRDLTEEEERLYHNEQQRLRRWLLRGEAIEPWSPHRKSGRALRGEEHPRTQLSAATVREIRAAYAAGRLSQRQVAEQYGVSKSGVAHIVTRRTWTHV